MGPVLFCRLSGPSGRRFCGGMTSFGVSFWLPVDRGWLKGARLGYHSGAFKTATASRDMNNDIRSRRKYILSYQRSPKILPVQQFFFILDTLPPFCERLKRASVSFVEDWDAKLVGQRMVSRSIPRRPGGALLAFLGFSVAPRGAPLSCEMCAAVGSSQAVRLCQ